MKDIEKDTKTIIENWENQYEIDEIQNIIIEIKRELDNTKEDIDENGYTIKENKIILSKLANHYEVIF